MLRARRRRGPSSTVYRDPALRKSLGVLYTSGYVQDASTRAARASEHSAFVATPFTPELLIDRVREPLATAEAEKG